MADPNINPDYDPNRIPLVRNANRIPPRNNEVRPIASSHATPQSLLKAQENKLAGPRQQYSTEKTPLSYAQKSVLTANPKSPFTIQKPLMPNILDLEEIESEKRLANERRKSGLKWKVVIQR